MKPTLYLETSVISYLTAKPSRDLIAYSRQEITRDWWEKKRLEYEITISEVVLEEAAQGDKRAAKRRYQLIKDIRVLILNPLIRDLASLLLTRLEIPESALPDLYHLSIASHYGIDYLVTWNCKHLANARIIKDLNEFGREMKFHVPVICTPIELLEA